MDVVPWKDRGKGMVSRAAVVAAEFGAEGRLPEKALAGFEELCRSNHRREPTRGSPRGWSRR